VAFQLAFARLNMAGRDQRHSQAGFGLAMLIDPDDQSQTPLVGTMFAYAAGAIFFALHAMCPAADLRASLEAIPLGAGELPHSLVR